MALGSNIFTEIPEAQSVDSESSTTSNEYENIHPVKLLTSSSVKIGSTSTSGVHELLECPVCTNSMYPPIHQVICFFFYPFFFFENYAIIFLWHTTQITEVFNNDMQSLKCRDANRLVNYNGIIFLFHKVETLT